MKSYDIFEKNGKQKAVYNGFHTFLFFIVFALLNVIFSIFFVYVAVDYVWVKLVMSAVIAFYVEYYITGYTKAKLLKGGYTLIRERVRASSKREAFKNINIANWDEALAEGKVFEHDVVYFSSTFCTYYIWLSIWQVSYMKHFYTASDAIKYAENNSNKLRS